MTRQMKASGVEWIGDIPAGWKVSKLKRFITCFDGMRKPVDSGERIPGPYPYWGAGSITDHVNDYIFDEEIILLGEDGAPFFDSTRPVAFLVNEKVWVNNHIHVLKTKEDMDSRFLVHFLNAVDYKSYINGSILNKLTQSNMNDISIACPSLQEQCRIAGYLDNRLTEIDNVLEKTRASINEYKKLKQSIITQAVTKGIRGDRAMKDSGIEWIGEIPEDWDAKRGKALFHEIKNLSTDGTEELLTVSQYTGITPRSQKNVTMFQSESLVGYKIVEIGDIGANTMWLWDGAIGVSTYRGVISPSYNVYRQNNGEYDSRYLDYLLRNPLLVQHYESKSTGIRASRLRLYPQQFLSIMFPLPDIIEQRVIAEYLDNKCKGIETLIGKKYELIADLEGYKNSLIYEYVTGKKEVPQA